MLCVPVLKSILHRTVVWAPPLMEREGIVTTQTGTVYKTVNNCFV